MAIRLKPYQNYDEKDVISNYALENANINEYFSSEGDGDIGVIVEISQADATKLPAVYVNDPAVGRTPAPHQKVLNNTMENPFRVQPAEGVVPPLGITLDQTAKMNNQGDNVVNLKDSEVRGNYAVFPGQSIRVVSEGILMFTIDAFDVADVTAPGIELNDLLTVSTAVPGKWAKVTADEKVYGKVIATSQEKNAKNSGKANKYCYIVKFSF